MTQITANDLKTRGIAAIEASLAGGRTEAMVSVRGADRFVVMELAQYQHLRECELEAALAESRADIVAGRYVVESPAEHVRRVQALVAGEATAKAGGNAKPGKSLGNALMPPTTPAAGLRRPASKASGKAPKPAAKPNTKPNTKRQSR